MQPIPQRRSVLARHMPGVYSARDTPNRAGRVSNTGSTHRPRFAIVDESAIAVPYSCRQPMNPFELHLWLADLDTVGATVSDLAEDERQRAERIRDPVQRRLFIGGRAALRQILSQYLNQPPRALRVSSGAGIKPTLGPDSALRFNVSRCRNLQLCALAENAPVGVDLEHVDDAGLREVASTYFTPPERAWVRSQPVTGQPAALARLWTIKEACLKALGTGLQRPLHTVRIPLTPGVPIADASQSVRVEIDGDGAWRVWLVTPSPGWTGAIAAADRAWTLRHFDLTPSGGTREGWTPGPAPPARA